MPAGLTLVAGDRSALKPPAAAQQHAQKPSAAAKQPAQKPPAAAPAGQTTAAGDQHAQKPPAAAKQPAQKPSAAAPARQTSAAGGLPTQKPPAAAKQPAQKPPAAAEQHAQGPPAAAPVRRQAVKRAAALDELLAPAAKAQATGGGWKQCAPLTKLKMTSRIPCIMACWPVPEELVPGICAACMAAILQDAGYDCAVLQPIAAHSGLWGVLMRVSCTGESSLPQRRWMLRSSCQQRCAARCAQHALGQPNMWF